jgi:hypothetical protein
MLDFFLDYRTNIPLYAEFQRFFRVGQPPTLMVWGRNDKVFPLRRCPVPSRSTERKTMESGADMKKSRRMARWLHRNRRAVIELSLPRQVTATRAPGDPAQSMTVLLLAPKGIESASMAAAILHLGVGRVVRVSSMATLRHVNHEPTHGDVAIVHPAPWFTSRRSVRHLKRAGWVDVIVNHNGTAAADLLDLPPTVERRSDR